MRSTRSERSERTGQMMRAGGGDPAAPPAPTPRARGYDVPRAGAGRKALAEAASRPPDAILLDLGLPDLDGTEVIREFRTWSGAPVIVLSGRAGSGDKIGALDAGADDYVTKPFSMEELLARLRAALRRDAG